MSLKELDLKKSYDSDKDNILRDFYIPALSHSTNYKRLAGFFSSSSLAVAAKGISKFISEEGHMRLIVGARLRKEDVDTIKEAHEDPEKVIENAMIKDLENLESRFIEDHVKALGWMVASGKLEIKVAIVCDENDYPLDREAVDKRGIFHQKVGILCGRDGNKISFSGSDNESASAWVDNIEEFKVFRSWENSEKEYLAADCDRFEKFWKGAARRTRVIDIPTAVKRKLIKIAPKDIEELNLEKWLRKKVEEKKKVIKLWNHQEQAIKTWLDNGKKGIFEMATGTGKTFAALGCLKKVLEEERRLIAVVSCPYGHLVRQWLDDIDEFGIPCDTVIADSGNSGWKDKLMDDILDIKNGISEKLIILTTHTTFSSDDFINIVGQTDTKLFLIADEVHGVGAPKTKKGLIEKYHFRLGLSATPKRWFDLEGTEELFDYFGGTVFEFPLKMAINTINPDTGRTYLVPYEYKPYLVELTDEELSEYERQTTRIARSYYRSKNKEEKDKWFSLLLFQRQEIIKNAVNKFEAFNRMLDEILDEVGEIKYCLVYCSPQQINKVQDILNSYRRQNIVQHRFTEKEGVRPEDAFGGISERGHLLHKLAEGVYHILVAMRCLDEGVDVPQVKTAVILSSTGNPRQYIQRSGRVLRRSPGKEKAAIYDIIVVPNVLSNTNPGLLELERKILEKELKRYKEFALIASNVLECLDTIESLEDRYNVIV